jgi:hypothetical protein
MDGQSGGLPVSSGAGRVFVGKISNCSDKPHTHPVVDRFGVKVIHLLNQFVRRILMSLYADILRGEYAPDNDLRQDGETWTVTSWLLEGEEIPGFTDKEMALAVARALRFAYEAGLANAQYS